MATAKPTANGRERCIPDETLRTIVYMERLTEHLYFTAFRTHYVLMHDFRNPDVQIGRFFERRVVAPLNLVGEGLATIVTAFGIEPNRFISVRDLESELVNE